MDDKALSWISDAAKQKSKCQYHVISDYQRNVWLPCIPSCHVSSSTIQTNIAHAQLEYIQHINTPYYFYSIYNTNYRILI
ncbi:predicted protein [Lichtheimia corymbifera JMRC:FSU:9682]|uniref:Uncharacterized protein n=1 Tax=Lichtheimia corymbifera JMRC:FSU:9682 TaxID=1263082 RepID=A0A068REW5_9FUNG|nr:predicted protein [Lichtheimia corymbifera JMRC:FSU:9682]